MRVTMIAAEAAPYVKVGGLADVVGALPAALAGLGVAVEVVLPGYRAIDRVRHGFAPRGTFGMDWAGRRVEVGCSRVNRPDGVAITLVEDPAAFDRPGVYDDPRTREGYADNPQRFAFFARAAAELCALDPPDVCQIHDAHGGLVPALLQTVMAWRFARRPATVVTIHNIAYPLLAPPAVLQDAGIPATYFQPLSPFEYHGVANFLKTALVFADAITTVSERYALEIQTPEYGHGLEGVLRERRGALTGILNGIDVATWDPGHDPHLAAAYDAKDLTGKRACREALLRELGLSAPAGVPVVGMVGRLADQKGLDLIAAAAGELASLPLRLVVLGSGQDKYHRLFQELAAARPEVFGVKLGFDEGLAHRIEAGADLFLMPSRFEPCGLNQMYSLRYGTPPIVRRTGGLADTVVDVDEAPGQGTGFVFDAPDPRAMMARLRAALSHYADRPAFEATMRRGMAQDFSWGRAAARYLEVFERVAAR